MTFFHGHIGLVWRHFAPLLCDTARQQTEVAMVWSRTKSRFCRSPLIFITSDLSSGTKPLMSEGFLLHQECVAPISPTFTLVAQIKEGLKRGKGLFKQELIYRGNSAEEMEDEDGEDRVMTNTKHEEGSWGWLKIERRKRQNGGGGASNPPIWEWNSPQEKHLNKNRAEPKWTGVTNWLNCFHFIPKCSELWGPMLMTSQDLNIWTRCVESVFLNAATSLDSCWLHHNHPHPCSSVAPHKLVLSSWMATLPPII